MIPTVNGPRHMPRAALVMLAAIVAAMLVSGCAKPRPAAVPVVDAPALWATFQERSLARQAESIRAAASLQLEGRRTGRVRIELWGQPDGALRMDVSAGFGSLVASLRQDPGTLVGYIPDQRTAYIQHGGDGTAAALGVPVPFGLAELSQLLSGQYAKLVAKSYDSVEIQPDGGLCYHVTGGKVSSITLDAMAQPVELTGRHKNKNWTLRLERYTDEADAAPRARRLDLRIQPGDRAVLRVKHVDTSTHVWPRGALELPLPPGTVMRPLDSLAPLEL